MVALHLRNLRIQQRKEESSKISQKEVHSRHRLFQRFHNTPVFIGQLLPFSFAPSDCPYCKDCIDMRVPFIFVETFNGIIRQILKLWAYTNVVLMTVWMGSPQTLPNRNCDTAASVCVFITLTDRASTLWSIIHLENKNAVAYPVRGLPDRRGKRIAL